MLFDSHAHYNDEKFSEDVYSLLALMPENNIGYIMNAASSTAEIPYILELCEKFPFMYASAGVHPHETEEMTDKDIEIIKEAVKHEKVKAIGEIGLDYFYDFSKKDVQKKWFARQIDLARELSMPIIIHDRDAHMDTMEILKEHKAWECGGVFHCYSGSVEMLRDVIEMGFYVAFGGSLTFKNSKRPKEAAAFAPMDRILLETDSPYLAPEPMRGKRNSSLYLRYVAELLAAIKGVSVSEIEKITTENAKKCFNIE